MGYISFFIPSTIWNTPTLVITTAPAPVIDNLLSTSTINLINKTETIIGIGGVETKINLTDKAETELEMQ